MRLLIFILPFLFIVGKVAQASVFKEESPHIYIEKAKQYLDDNPKKAIEYIDSLEKIGPLNSGLKVNAYLFKIKANVELGAMNEAKELLNQLEIELLVRERAFLAMKSRNQELKLRSSNNLVLLFTILIITSLTMLYLFRERYLAKLKTDKKLQDQYDEITSRNRIINQQNEEIKNNLDELQRAEETISDQNKKLKEQNDHLERMVEQRSQKLMKVMKHLSVHINTTPLAIVELDTNYRFTRWTRQAESLFGWKPEEILGKSIREVDFVHEDFEEEVFEGIGQLLEGKNNKSTVKNKVYNKYKNTLFVEWSNSVLYNSKEEPETILCIANDVSKREKALTELKESNNELDHFIYKASHDLQGPIARMKGVINLGLIEGKEDISKKYFRILNTVTINMETLLRKLQKIHEIHDHKVKLQPFSPKKFMKNRVAKYKDQGMCEGITFNFDIEGKKDGQTDLFLLEIIIDNLIENIISNRLKVHSRALFEVDENDIGILKFKVSDNGVGIEPGTEHKIFDMFFQTSTDNITNGLGLYITRKAVEKLGGSIKLLKPKNDTTFEVILPGF